MSKTKAYEIIQSILCIVIGILIACSIISENLIDYILAISLIVIGVLLFVRTFAYNKPISFILPSGLIGGTLIGVGVAMLCRYILVIDLMAKIVIIAIACVGALLLLDGIVNLARKRTNAGLTEVIVGVILLVLGILFLIFYSEVVSVIWIIFGVLLAVYGVYSLVLAITRISKK